MSALTSFAGLLAMPVPAWIVLFAIAGLYAIQQVRVVQRVERHARILGHLDRWANGVEQRLDELGQGRPPAQAGSDRGQEQPVSSLRRRKDFRSLSNEQVQALITRLVGTRAA